MQLSPDTLRKALEQYGLPFGSVIAIAKGYRNTSHLIELENSTRINLIVYKSESGIQDRIRRTNQLASIFTATPLPVRTPIDTRLSVFRVNDRFFHISIYNYLPGHTIPWEAYTMKHIKLLGWAIGEFHKRARSFTGQLPSVSDEYFEHIREMSRYFSDPNVVSAMHRKLGIAPNIPFDTLAKTVTSLSSLPHQQALHLDFVRGNILFDEARPGDMLQLGNVAVSGILDLEKASYGHPVWDVARSLGFLLVDCPKPADKIFRYFIQSGYRKRADQTIALPLLNEALNIFLIYDFYKFLRDNPYESLAQNHHYQRTRDILTKIGMLYLIGK